jgi:hypothetical protein
MWKIDPKDERIQKFQARSCTNSDEEHVCNSGSTLWNSRKEEKEKTMIQHH